MFLVEIVACRVLGVWFGGDPLIVLENKSAPTALWVLVGEKKRAIKIKVLPETEEMTDGFR